MSNKFYTNVSMSKNDILLCGYENGKRVRDRVPYKPYLFVPTQENTKYTTLDQKKVGKIDFDSIWEARDFLKTYKDVQGMPIYGLNNFVYTYIYDNYQGEILYDPTAIAVTSLDIEVDIANEKGFPNIEVAGNEITLITISRNGKKATFGCQPYKLKNPNNTYYLCNDEKHLLRLFIEKWNSKEFSPDVVTGWNIEPFDIPYLVNRIIKVLGRPIANKLSPWGSLQESRLIIMGREVQFWNIVGITTLDYMQLYKKFAYTIQESYSLDHVCFQELGEKKLDYGEYGSLAGLQVGNWELYVDYNIRDVELVDMLDDKLKLVELVFAMAYDAKTNYQDTFTTVRAWDVIIHNYLLKNDVVVPQIDVPEFNRGILGGYVKDPQVGMHKWVMSFDLASLYPHIIMQYNISPETFAGWFMDETECEKKEWAEERALKIMNGYIDNEKHAILTDNDITITGNWTTFKRDKQGFLPALMKQYYDERVIYKNKMIKAKIAYEACIDKSTPEAVQLVKDIAKFNNLQMAKKIQLNSAYGALGNKFFRWYRNEFAEAITSSGQLATRWIERAINKYLNKLLKTEDYDYVIACDTDSVYIKLNKLVDAVFTNQGDTDKIVKFLDTVAKEKLGPLIDKSFDELCLRVNGREQKMIMKRECIANKGIWTAKKHYILNMNDNEGVPHNPPKLKMMGIEAIRTSTPQVCRDGIKHALGLIMNKEEIDLQNYIAQFRQEFSTLTFQQVASPRSVSDLDKYADGSSIFKKGTPINAKGALIYNHHLKRLKLSKKYEEIASGQKIKYAYCVVPNPFQCTVIACPGELPKEFGMDRYINRDMQFNKAFVEPIKTIVNCIDWEVEKRATLDSFFA